MAPRSCTELFTAFTSLALQGFGGVMGVAQRELVERRQWLTNDEFLQETALAQALPGPNVCNLALSLGDRHFGWRGAVAAIAGLMLAPLMILLVLVLAYGRWAGHPVVASALWGMGAVTSGMIAGTALKLMVPLRSHPLGVPVAALLATAAFVGLALLRWPIAAVIFSLGGLGVASTAWALRREQRARSDEAPPSEPSA